MAPHPVLCGWTVIIITILSNKGCHSVTECGAAVRNIRIVGGQAASPGRWPWQVSLQNDRGALCAGSLITNTWVLTAAHCLTGQSSLRAFVGRLDHLGPKSDKVFWQVAEMIIHPSYNLLTKNNDIGLLRLSEPVNFSINVYPVCLAATGSTYHTGTSSWVTGWGATANGSHSNILQEVNLPIVGKNECRCAHPGLTKNMICAGLRAGGKDACQGDSGAPLVTKTGSVWVQMGLVSFGVDCALPMIPGVYTDVSKYQNWIRNVTRNSKPGFVRFNSPGVDRDANFTCPTSPPI